MQGRSYYIHTFGCQMNVHDSEQLAGSLEALGYSVAVDENEADIVLLNTCSVREKADQKMFSLLGRIALIKQERPELKVGVCGCIAQRDGEAMFARAPAVDFVLGTRSINRLAEVLEEVGQSRRIAVTDMPDAIDEGPVYVRRSSAVAYVTIMEGCNNFCSYCIVPYVRGREISRASGRIVDEVRRLADEGYKEIQLLGQNVNSYRDPEKRGSDFADLLDKVAGVGGIERIRFITSHPKDFTERIAEVMAAHENICNAIHMPPQSGSDRVLKGMRRGYSRAGYLEKIEILKYYLKNVHLSGDFIVGFPGESEEDFKLSLALVDEVRFAMLFTFIYSPRPGTAAAKLEDGVEREIKVERLKRLQELQARIQTEAHEKMVGGVYGVLIEGESARGNGQLSGRTEGNIVVNLEGSRELIGDIVSVRIIEAGTHSVGGQLAEPA